MRLRILGAAVAATAAVVIAPATTPAQAAPAAATGRHCVVDVSTPTAMTCFDSLSTALSRVTGQQISAATAASDLDATVDAANASNAGKQSLNRAAAAASIVIGIEYTGNNHSGSSLVVSGTHTCDFPTATREFWLNTLPSGWNDDIESFKAYAGCAAMHYLDIFMGGPREGWYTSWGGLGAVEDEVSSIEWS